MSAAQATVLTPEQQSIFLTFANILAEKEEGTASHLAFYPGEYAGDPAGGLEQWGEAVKIKNFPVNREARLVKDNSIVTEFTQALLEDIEERGTSKKISFAEIGPGLWESVRVKTTPYIQALQKSQHPVTRYIAIDPSAECAKPAADGISKLFPKIKSSALVSSFEEAKGIPANTIPVAVLWGPTIWNTGISPDLDPELALASQIKSIKQVVKSGGYILSTYYSSETHEIDAAAYNDNRNLKLVQSLAHRIERKLDDTNFKADSFEPYVEYKGNGIGRYCMGIRSKEDQIVNLNGSVVRPFKAGEKMVLTNSWRLKEQKLYNIVSAAGADMIKHTFDKKIGAGMFLAKFR